MPCRAGFLPNLYLNSGQSTSSQSLINEYCPLEHSIHLARIAFTGVGILVLILVPP